MKKRKINITYIIIGLFFISQFMSNRFQNPGEWFYNTLIILPGIIVGIAFHEFAHAIVSYKLGDDTPKNQGRVTLNPLAHIDLFGFLALIFVGFGWGKPVQINPRNYKNPRRDEFFVSIAGVITNFILAFVFALLLKLLAYNNGILDLEMTRVVTDVLTSAILINLVLMIFNLIPIPPLDGFGIVTQIFNLKKYGWYNAVYQNGMWILFIFIFLNAQKWILTPSVTFLLDIIIKVVKI